MKYNEIAQEARNHCEELSETSFIKRDSQTQDAYKDGFCDGAQWMEQQMKQKAILSFDIIAKICGMNDRHVLDVFKESLER